MQMQMQSVPEIARFAKSASLLTLLFLTHAVSGAAAADDGRFVQHGFAAADLILDGLAAVRPGGLLVLTNATYQWNARAFHPTPLHFFTKSTAAATSKNATTARSFSTSFVFAITSDHDGWSAHGLAFLVAPTTKPAAVIGGQYLGLLNATNGSPSDPILAIELDTVYNPEFRDIDGNHVGVDVNSLISEQAWTAGYYDDGGGALRELKLNNGEPMQVWVDYDGLTRQLDVTLAPAQVPKPRKPLISTAIDLSTAMAMADPVYIGFSAATGVLTTNHYVLGWSFSLDGPAPSLDFSKLPAVPREGPKPSRSKLLEVVLPLATASLVVAALAFFVARRRSLYAEVREHWEDEFGPHRFTYKDLFHATHGFHDSNLLGVGGFGRVYKGKLAASNLEIAVKKVSHDSRQGVREFVAEVVSIGRLRHRNLVQLLGYCRRKGELLLVYDYMENGSLDKYVHGHNGPPLHLHWHQRYWIIKGIASSLLYLHEDWEHVVIHRDIKASNVLLDREMNGRLGDFGLARLYDHGTVPQTTHHVVGTMGYLAPELLRNGKASPSTDVFAFGVFLLEVACGRRPVGDESGGVLVDWVIQCSRNSSILDALDPKLQGKYDAEEATLVLKLGLMCSHPLPDERPSMRRVIQYLDSSLPFPDTSAAYTSYSIMASMQMQGFDSYAKVSCSESSCTTLLTATGERT